MKKYLSTLIMTVTFIALLFTFVACSLPGEKDKTFSKAGMSITLTDAFTEQDIVTQTAYYVSMKSIVTALKEDGTPIPDYTVKDYANLVCKVNNLDSEVTVKDGYAEFTYEKEVSGKDYYYYARCFKNGTDFWLFQFACETKNTDELQETFDKWASTVVFDD